MSNDDSLSPAGAHMALTGQAMQLYFDKKAEMEERIRQGNLKRGDTVVEFKAPTRESRETIGMALLDDLKNMWPDRSSAITPAFRPKGNAGYGVIYLA